MKESIIGKNSEKQIGIEIIVMSKEEGIRKIVIKKVFKEEFEIGKEKLQLSEYSGNE